MTNNEISTIVVDIVNNHFPSGYSIYDAVKFLYGKHRAVQTAIIDLLKKDIIELDGKYFRNKATASDLVRYKNPLIPKLVQQGNEQLTYDSLVNMFDEKNSNSSFSQLYNFANKPTYWQAFIYFPVLFIGVVRIIQGVSNDKPVEYLIVFIVVFTFAFRMINRSVGKKKLVFKTCEQKFNDDHLSSMDLQPHDEILRSFSYSGVNAITGFKEYTLLATMFAAYPVIDHYGSSNTGFSDGGSSCSSCSSCGGGCGGCGGD